MSKRIQTLAPNILKDYREGKLSLRELEEKYGICYKTIYNLLEKENSTIIDKSHKTRNGNYINLPLDEIEEMYLEGYTVQEIAELYYVSHTTIAFRLKEIGLKASQRLENRTKFIKNEIKKIYPDTSITVNEIAERLQTHPTTVYKYARKLELHRPKATKEIYLGRRVDKDKFIEVYNKYSKYEIVAYKLHISVASVRKYALMLGLPLKNSRKYIINEDNMEKFINMYNDDLKIIDIAKYFNTSDTVIRKTAKRLGLQNTIKVGENNEM